MSSSPERVTTLRRAAIQAQQSAQLALRHGGGAVLSDELRGRHAYLLALQDRTDVDEFRQTLLGELERHDRSADSGLLAGRAAEAGARMLVAPEMAVTGYALGPSGSRRWPSRCPVRSPCG